MKYSPHTSLAVILLLFSVSCSFKETQPRSPVAYINPDAPAVAEPQYAGTYYMDTVPDTLDLAHRADLAVNALTETTDPHYDYELYWIADLLAETPAMYHTPDDHVQAKFLQSLPLCRIASGSKQNLKVERALLETYLKMQGADGLIYIPIQGRPWALPTEPNAWAGLDYLPAGDHWSSLVTTGRTLGAFCVYAVKDPSGPWAEAANRLVEGYKKVAIQDADVAYLFLNCTEPGKAVTRPENPPVGFRAAVNGWVAQGLAQAYLTLGNTIARDLALKMMTYVMRDSDYFGPKGEFLEDFPGVIHFHAHTNQILASLEVVQATNNLYLLQRATQAYDYAVAQGQPLLGFFPEFLHTKNYPTSEICEVADMIACAVKFSLLGVDKWDDVDRWVRNQFAESQLTDNQWRKNASFVPVDRSVKPFGGAGTLDPVAEFGTTDRVLERAVGSFSGWPSVNDRFHGSNWSVMHCCTGNGTRTLYYVWKNIVHFDNDVLKVNLLLNRASRWADVYSYIPHEGRVDVKIKQPLGIEVRIPEWAAPKDITCTVNEKPRSLTFDGRYAQLGEVAPDDLVTVRFLLPEVTETIAVQGADYTITRRGNSVVAISPPGTNSPLYQDESRRTGPVAFRKVERFVPDLEIPW